MATLKNSPLLEILWDEFNDKTGGNLNNEETMHIFFSGASQALESILNDRSNPEVVNYFKMGKTMGELHRFWEEVKEESQ